jgi:Ribbon-helix-helix protein, copG family
MRKRCVFIGAWVPESVAAAVDEAARTLNLDRSRFLRRILQEKTKMEDK